jgi:ATP-dependent DNA helicase DinG
MPKLGGNVALTSALVPPLDAAAPPASDVAGVAQTLARVVAALPGGGEARPGQVRMAEEIARAIDADRHVAVRAGTGTGKTLAYLVPAVLSGRKVVVATATKALQDQLAGKDLPFLERHLGRPFTWAVLKGRSNYLCVQRLAEVLAGLQAAAARADQAETSDQADAAGPADGAGSADTAGRSPDETRSADVLKASQGAEQLALDGLAERVDPEELVQLASWASATATGDRADLTVEPSDAAWSAVSTSARDCPGAHRCPRGDACFAEAARDRAAEADVVVVNLHLYGLHLASDGAILPDHDVAIIDEAHLVEDIISATSGIEIGPGRFAHLSRVLRGVLAGAGDVIAGVADAADLLTGAITPHRDRRLTAPLPGDVTDALVTIRARVDRAQNALRAIPDETTDDATARAIRARQAATALVEDIDAVARPGDDHVLWVAGPEHAPVLRLAPVDVAALLSDRLWTQRPAVLTSATLPSGFGPHIGLPHGSDQLIDVGSPFDYPTNGLLYCAARLPRPTDPRWPDAAIDELAALIEAAGGRTLALFTSHRVMRRAVDTLRARLHQPLLVQGDLPKPRLVERFAREPETCLFATMSYWQGIDVPGPSLSLVTIDRLPFPRPDDPLLQARRDRAGEQAFLTIDVPRAATLLAQGTGRLIRTASDRGAVAILDPRLATARYGPKIVAALPKMRRTKDRADIERFLRELRQS